MICGGASLLQESGDRGIFCGCKSRLLLLYIGTHSCAALRRCREDFSYQQRWVDDADDHRAACVVFRKKRQNEGKAVVPSYSLNVVHCVYGVCRYIGAHASCHIFICT